MAQRFENKKRGWRFGHSLQPVAVTLRGPAAFWGRGWSRGVCMGALAVCLFAGSARAQDCTTLLGLFQQGRSTADIAQMTGLTSTDVEACRQQLRQPIFVGPAGAPPMNAVGPPPRNPAGPPPFGAAGRRRWSATGRA